MARRSSRSRPGFLVVALAVAVAACGPRSAPSSAEPAAEPQADRLSGQGPAIEIRRVADGVWLHDSWADKGSFGRVHANGLIVAGARGAVIVDSSWTPAQTQWLLDRVEEATGKPARALVATHFHDDRAGGAAAARAAGVPVYASTRTRALLGDSDDISHPFESEAAIDLGDRRLELYFPGAGHSRDNIVVYLPDERLLFGGCLVRAGESDWIGYLADADVAAWPATMERLIERYAGVRTVVPGHGAVGGADLLEHTRTLATEAAL